ncbi:MAG: methylenetetrahydrofolate reductase [Xanthobacteraceae bacterium]
MSTAPRQTASRLRELLQARHFAITAELAPPVSFDVADLVAKAAPLKGLADAINITDGASARAHLSAPIAAAILAREGLEPILQLTCRDRNRIALQGDLMGAAATGVSNILLLTGDDPKAGDQPETKPVFDVDSVTLTRMARDLRDTATLPSGRKVSGHADFFLGTADAPIDPPAGWQPEKLAAKIAAGAEFAQTQFCMDAGIARRYAARLSEHAATRNFYLLIGIAPLRSAKSARWMKAHLFGTIIPDALIERMEHAADPAAEGERIAVELIEQFASMPGIAGVHIMAPANDAAVPRVIAQARQRLPQHA